MKSTIFMICLLACFTFSIQAQAQLSKQEKKEWKKKLKDLEPEQYKSMTEENASLKGQVSNLNSEVSSMQSRLTDKDAKISELQSKVNSLESELAAAKAAATGPDNSIDVSPNKTKAAKGVVFKVQIGAFKNKDLSKYMDQGESFSGESADGMQKYTLGTFTDYWEADKFKKYLREMGVKDAWIVPYKDGVRVPIKDVLEGVL